MASLAIHDEWIVARDLLINLIKNDLQQVKIIESNFINNYLGEYCDFGRPAHWFGDVISTNGMEGNHKLTKSETPTMLQVHHGDNLLATVGAISIRQQKITTKTFHHEPIQLPSHWKALPIVASRPNVTFDYATAVFFDHRNGGKLILKEGIPNFMNETSHIVIYIPTKKLHNEVFDRTKLVLANGSSLDDDRSHREVVLDTMHFSKDNSNMSGRNLSQQTSTFTKHYEKLMYEELHVHTVEAKENEDIFDYLNRRVHRDNILVKEWKNKNKSRTNAITAGKSKSRVVLTMSKKLQMLKDADDMVDFDIDTLVDEEYEKVQSKDGSKSKKVSNDYRSFSDKCGKCLKKQQLGNFIRVEVENGSITCNCESFMKYGFCPEKALFSLLCKKMPPPSECVSGDGVQWVNSVRTSLISKFQTHLFEKKQTNRHQDKDLLNYSFVCPQLDPQLDEKGGMKGRVTCFNNSFMYANQDKKLKNRTCRYKKSEEAKVANNEKSPPYKRSKCNE